MYIYNYNFITSNNQIVFYTNILYMIYPISKFNTNFNLIYFLLFIYYVKLSSDKI